MLESILPAVRIVAPDHAHLNRLALAIVEDVGEAVWDGPRAE